MKRRELHWEGLALLNILLLNQAAANPRPPCKPLINVTLTFARAMLLFLMLGAHHPSTATISETISEGLSIMPPSAGHDPGADPSWKSRRLLISPIALIPASTPISTWVVQNRIHPI